MSYVVVFKTNKNANKLPTFCFAHSYTVRTGWKKYKAVFMVLAALLF